MTHPAVRTLLHLILFAAAAVPRAEAQRGWSEVTTQFDTFAHAAGIVGGSAVLVRNGEIVARHHYGFADRAAKRPVTERTIYHWASVTKTLTAIAMLQLRDRRRLSLDDRVTRWVPELREVHGPVRRGGSHHPPHAAVAHLRPAEPDLALVERRAVGAVRADDVEPARGHDAVPGAPLLAGRAVSAIPIQATCTSLASSRSSPATPGRSTSRRTSGPRSA